MAKKDHISETPATQLLTAYKVLFTEHPYKYLEHGGAQHSAEVLGVLAVALKGFTHPFIDHDLIWNVVKRK